MSNRLQCKGKELLPHQDTAHKVSFHTRLAEQYLFSAHKHPVEQPPAAGLSTVSYLNRENRCTQAGVTSAPGDYNVCQRPQMMDSKQQQKQR